MKCNHKELQISQWPRHALRLCAVWPVLCLVVCCAAPGCKKKTDRVLPQKVMMQENDGTKFSSGNRVNGRQVPESTRQQSSADKREGVGEQESQADVRDSSDLARSEAASAKKAADSARQHASRAKQAARQATQTGSKAKLVAENARLATQSAQKSRQAATTAQACATRALRLAAEAGQAAAKLSRVGSNGKHDANAAQQARETAKQTTRAADEAQNWAVAAMRAATEADQAARQANEAATSAQVQESVEKILSTAQRTYRQSRQSTQAARNDAVAAVASADKSVRASEAGNADLAARTAEQARQSADSALQKAAKAKDQAQQLAVHADQGRKIIQSTTKQGPAPTGLRQIRDVVKKLDQLAQDAATAATEAEQLAAQADLKASVAQDGLAQSQTLAKLRQSAARTSQLVDHAIRQTQLAVGAATEANEAAEQSIRTQMSGDRNAAAALRASGIRARTRAQRFLADAQKKMELATAGSGEVRAASEALSAALENEKKTAEARRMAEQIQRVMQSGRSEVEEGESTVRKLLDRASRILAQHDGSGPKVEVANAGDVEASPSESVAEVSTRSEINEAEIPVLPSPPPAVNVARPEGAINLGEGKSEPTESLGRWRQTDASNGADFLPGGYVTSVLIFRADKVLEVHRTFGPKGAVSCVWRIGCKWNEDRTHLVLGKAGSLRPPEELLGGLTLKGNIKIEKPKTGFPVTLTCTRLDDGTIRLGTKEYRPVVKTWESFEVDEKK